VCRIPIIGLLRKDARIRRTAGGIQLQNALAGAYQRKVFVSHSANDDPFAVAVRDKLAARLEENGYLALVDSAKLKPGQDWNNELYDWLGACHAAVILVTGKALASFWVRRETNILLWRRARNKGFVVIPALLAISEGEVAATGLTELAPVQAARCDGTGEADRDAVVEAIMERFPETLPEVAGDPLCRWLQRIARNLHTIQLYERDVLQEAGRHLDLPADLAVEWAHEDACRLIAAQMIGAGLPDRRLELALSAVVRSMDIGPFAKLRSESLPAWVDAEAARLVLPERRDTEPDRKTVYLDVSSEEIAVDYIARAMCREVSDYDHVTVKALPVGEHPEQEILQSCRAAVRTMLVLDDDDPLTPDVVRPRGKVHYLVLHPGLAPPAAVATAAATLRQECRWLVMVVLSGGGRMTPAILASAGIADVVLVEPRLAPDDEIQARQLRRAVARLTAENFG